MFIVSSTLPQKMCFTPPLSRHVWHWSMSTQMVRSVLTCSFGSHISQECWDWMGLPEGNTGQCLLVQLRFSMMFRKDESNHSIVCAKSLSLFYCLKLITNPSLMWILWVLSEKCWCKERLRMPPCHWLAVPTLSSVTRFNITVMSGPNRLWFMVVTLPGHAGKMFFPVISVHMQRIIICCVAQQHLPLSSTPVGCPPTPH